MKYIKFAFGFSFVLLVLFQLPSNAQVLATNTTPRNGARAFSRSGDVVAQFNTTMRGSTITSNRFFVVNSQSGYRNGAISFNATTNQATLTPSTDFRAGEFLTAQLTRGITNSAGTTELTTRTWQFHADVRTNGGAFVEQHNADINGYNPDLVCLGDLNGDGYLDCFMSCNNYGGPIYTNLVWTNNGSGVFSIAQRIGNRTDIGMTLGDVDRDGDLDAVFLSSTYTNQVWTNNGAGVFTWFQNLTNINAMRVTLDDLNGDGWLDMVLIEASSGGHIWTNNRAGRLSDSGQRLPGANTVGVRVGDINGDGFPDILMGGDVGVQVFTNNGSGVFTDAARNFGSGTANEIPIGDIDGDGDLDVVLGRSFDPIQIFTNNGSGTFSYTGQSLGIYANIDLADMDGDGDLDIVTPKYLYLNNGSGTFTQSATVDFGGGGFGLDTGDVDNDGDVDVMLVQNPSFGYTAVWKNVLPAMSVLGTNSAVIVNGEAASAAKGTDFGFVLAGMAGTNRLAITNSGPGTLNITGVTTSGTGAAQFSILGMPTTVQQGTKSNFSVTFTASVAGLSTAAVSIANNSTNTPFVLNISGVARFSARVTNTVPANAAFNVGRSSNVTAQFSEAINGSTVTSNRFILYSGQSGFRPGAISFNTSTNAATLNPATDFRPGEVVYAGLTRAITSADGMVTLMPHAWSFSAAAGKGPGRFVDSRQTLGTNASWCVKLGDVDRDGDLDAAVSGLNRPSTVWTNQGGRFFLAQQLSNTASRSLALGDVDRDGDLDIFIANYNSPYCRVWTNNGSGFFADSGQSLNAGGAYNVALADFDGDGDLDAYVGVQFAPHLIFTNNGSGLFFNSGQALGSQGAYGVAVGDLNNDGSLDLAMAGYSTGDRVFTNNGNGIFYISQLLTNQTTTLGASRGLDIGDVNGDGKLDIVVAESDSDGHRVWTNRGNASFALSQTLNYEQGRQVALADFDADGDLDAFFANDGVSTLWKNNGAGVFSDSGQTLPSPYIMGMAAGDVNGDGAIDVYAVSEPPVYNDPAMDIVWLNGDYFVIMASSGPNGTISPSGPVMVETGAGTSFVAAANTYWHIGQLLTNGVAVAAATNKAVYTSAWAAVTANGTITVSFAENLAPLNTPEWWLAKYGWTNNFNSWETNDTDSDRQRAWEEYIAGTVPTNGQDYLKFDSILSSSGQIAIDLMSHTGRLYDIDLSSNLLDGSGWSPVTGNVSGTENTLSITNAPASGPQLYRIRVRKP